MSFFNCRFAGALPGGDVHQFGWWAESEDSITSILTAAEAWIDALWSNVLASVYTSNTTINRVTVGRYETIGDPQQEAAEQSKTLAGTVDPLTNPPLPGDVAMVVSLRTSLANRRGRGRFYLPPPAVTQVTDVGRINGTLRDDVASEIATQTGTFNTAVAGNMVVVSRVNAAAVPVTEISVGDLWDTQRRRENALVESRENVAI